MRPGFMQRRTEVEIIERIDDWRKQFNDWKASNTGASKDELADSYPLVKNRHAPFLPARRALPMLNLALISSAGAYIDGTAEFGENDLSFKEIPIEVEASDLR